MEERRKYVAYFGDKLREHLRMRDNALLRFPRFIEVRAEVAADQYLKARPDVPDPCVAWDRAMDILLKEIN